MQLKSFGKTGLNLPNIVFGTSALGNLYMELSKDTKKEIVEESVYHTRPVSVFDSAGKYGAGLALESLRESLDRIGANPENIIISNKLGWVRSPLVGEEPLFEPGVWKGLQYDAVQKISYQGILDCFEEGNQLLKNYIPQLVSVHDPDEYLARAKSPDHEAELFEDILEAYKALEELKQQGLVKGVGVGSKDWRVIPRIYEKVPLDWVMFANSMTLIDHPKELQDFMGRISNEGVGIINSAVFQSGFLVGGDYYDYKLIKPDSPKNIALFQWRDDFFAMCKEWQISPAHACIQFALHVPGVNSVALSTTNPGKVKENIRATQNSVPEGFWEELKKRNLLGEDSPV